MVRLRDADIPEGEWNRYLRDKYMKVYKTSKQEDNVWVIKCRYGEITPYSIVNGTLLYCGVYHSAKKKTGVIKVLENTGLVTITQEGDTEFCCRFNEQDLAEIGNKIVIRKKRTFTENLTI